LAKQDLVTPLGNLRVEFTASEKVVIDVEDVKKEEEKGLSGQPQPITVYNHIEQPFWNL
jgi:hypothetical protein